MRDFVMNTSTQTATAVSEKEFKSKISSDARAKSTVSRDVAASVAKEDKVPVAKEEQAAADTEAAETVVPEDTVVSEEAIAAEEAGEVAPVEASTAEDGVITNMTDTMVISEPAPIMDGGFIGKDGDMYMDPVMETGMAQVKDPLLSSWPFVIGISAGVLLISMVLGALLARRKIKKGIELYED